MRLRDLAVTVAVLAVLAVAAATTSGCSATTVAGDVSPGEAAMASKALESYLLSPDEINAAMGTAGMAPGTTQSTLVDDAGRTAPVDCLAASSVGQERVYADSGWTAVRIQSLHESGDDFEHLAHQAVAEFPTSSEASAFLARSTRTWNGCARAGRFTYSPGGGDADVVWLVSPAHEQNAVLTMPTPQQDGDGWTCQRALAAALNIVADVMTCSYAADDPGATTIARQITDRVTGR